MKTNHVFTLHNIAGTAYLLPHGQGIADHKRGISLNETGAFLWNALLHCTDRKQLLQQFADYCKASDEDLPRLDQDLTNFLRQLYALGILSDDASSHLASRTAEPAYDTAAMTSHMQEPADSSLFLQIGPIRIHLIGPAETFAPEFLPFQTLESCCADLRITLTHSAPKREKMRILIENPELCVYETDTSYFLQFPHMTQFPCARLSKNGKQAEIYYQLPVTPENRLDLFHIIRFLFLYTAQKHGCFVLHSASVLYREKAWLFSAPSGIGKSTHANLWKKHFQTPVLNGDLNLLAITDGTPVIHGTPWCGTSGIADTATYPCGGIILLSRGTYDKWISLSADQKILLTAQRLISPAWDARMLQCNLDFISVLASKIPICRLQCTKTYKAAETARKWADQSFM